MTSERAGGREPYPGMMSSVVVMMRLATAASTRGQSARPIITHATPHYISASTRLSAPLEVFWAFSEPSFFPLF